MGDYIQFGKLLMLIGCIILAAGLFISFAGKFLPFGKLPGDIFIKKDNFTFYFPIVTSIILSIVLSFILNFFSRK